MQNRTVILVDSISIICVLIFLVVFDFTAGFTDAEIFADFSNIYLSGVLSLILFAISTILAIREHNLSARIVMIVGFVMVVTMLVIIVAFHASLPKF